MHYSPLLSFHRHRHSAQPVVQSKLDALAPPDAPAHVGVQVRNRLWIQDAHKVGVQNSGERIVRCMGAWVRPYGSPDSKHDRRWLGPEPRSRSERGMSEIAARCYPDRSELKSSAAPTFI